MPAKKKAKKDLGHAEHTQKADAKGLQGTMPRPIKVTLLGAGSGFTPRLVTDIISIPGEQGGTIALVDIDKSRLVQMTKIIEMHLEKAGKADKWKVTANTDRRKVMKKSDYLVSCIEVSGLACVRHDNDIPAKYGIDQCIGDTLGPGGLFKGLRTIPVWLDVLKDAEELCPGAIVLNYTNPMGMMCLASFRTSFMPVVGLCHSVQGTSHLLAKYADIPYEELAWECAGINHLAWFTRLEQEGKSLYPKLFKKWKKEIDDPEAGDIVRKDMAMHFGAFITESSGHLSEYLPYYRKREDLRKRYMRARYDGESGFYADNWPTWRQNRDDDLAKLIKSGEGYTKNERSWEYASWIVEAREKDVPFRIHGNVYNKQGDGGTLITNLPADGCVEVATMIDQNGLNPTRYRALPAQMAAICNSNMSMIDLAATAVIERSKEAAIHALMLDPLSSAVCSPAEIKAMTLELFAAEEDFLPDYK